MPDLAGVTNLTARTAFMATGSFEGEVYFWDEQANSIEVVAYPVVDDGVGGSNWGNEVYFVSRAGDAVAVGDLDYPQISVAGSASLNHRKSYTDPAGRSAVGYAGPLGVNGEFWVFVTEYHTSADVWYVKRFSPKGDLLGTIPVGVPTSTGTGNVSWVATWDSETFYLVEGQQRPRVWQWVPGSPMVLLGSIWSDLQGPYPGAFGSGGDGECRSIAMHGPSELLATTYNQVFDYAINDFRTHAALVRFSLPDLAVLHRYEISDDLAHIPLLDTVAIPIPPDPNNQKNYVLPFICASDGAQMWVANWSRGEIWKLSDGGVFTLWNHTVFDQFAGIDVFNIARPMPIAMNVRDFTNYSVPMASFHNRIYPGRRPGRVTFAHQATDPTIKYAAARRLQ